MAGVPDDREAAARATLRDVTVWEDGPGGPLFVWVCELCGQPCSPGNLCNSAIHVGPHKPANGKVVKSTDLAARGVRVPDERKD